VRLVATRHINHAQNPSRAPSLSTRHTDSTDRVVHVILFCLWCARRSKSNSSTCIYFVHALKVTVSQMFFSRSKDASTSAQPSGVRGRAARAAGREDPELLAEQLSRNSLFLGEDGQTAVRESFVVVVGAGGVGSHAAHMLAREWHESKIV
jgi:hypothetical protein